MLGHKSAAMTLDTWTDLFETDVDAAADRLSEAAEQDPAAYLRTPGHAPADSPALRRVR